MAKYRIAIMQLRKPEVSPLWENSLTSSSTPLTIKTLEYTKTSGDSDWLTQIDNADVHPEGFTREIGHVAHVVAHVPDGNQPVEYSCPYSSPADELWVDGRVIADDDIVDRVVEERYQSSNPDNRERLGTQNAEDHSSQRR